MPALTLEGLGQAGRWGSPFRRLGRGYQEWLRPEPKRAVPEAKKWRDPFPQKLTFWGDGPGYLGWDHRIFDAVKSWARLAGTAALGTAFGGKAEDMEELAGGAEAFIAVLKGIRRMSGQAPTGRYAVEASYLARAVAAVDSLIQLLWKYWGQILKNYVRRFGGTEEEGRKKFHGRARRHLGGRSPGAVEKDWPLLHLSGARHSAVYDAVNAAIKQTHEAILGLRRR